MSMPDTSPLLKVENLAVDYTSGRRVVPAVRDASFHVAAGETVALVGGSGSGKTTTARAVIGLLPASARLTGGRILFTGPGDPAAADLARAPEPVLRQRRGRHIGLVPQDPMVSLNPVRTIGWQVAEVLAIHRLAPDRRTARARAADLLDQAGLPNAHTLLDRFPHELSGGMCQRVLIAIALAAGPALLIADEPTSALDVTVQRRILDHIATLTRDSGTALLLVTHDLAVAADRADRVVVMADGMVRETGSVGSVLGAPRDRATRDLVDALARPAPRTNPPPATPGVTPLISGDGLVKRFGSGTAVDHVSIRLDRGETVALVGESGSGKTTTARLLLRLTAVSAGKVRFDGADITAARGRDLRQLRRRMQMVYQSPYASLDPRLTIADAVTAPLRAYRVGNRADRAARAADLLDRVRLPTTVLDRRPGELSGGQCQRVAIARALALEPDLVVLDEPVSALDASNRNRILELLHQLRTELGLSYLIISHDLGVVREIADRVAVMRAGRVVETGPVADVLGEPVDPYTRELVDAAPGAAAGDLFTRLA
ncbi:ABC transporter ATP-binding protein [Micromonospora sp. NPDC048905]|uniref:ABC transporter ATP-binding protein n=1 Tax=Micromonospora sp. NPDC048905 TaxID=3155494 RepID=UPI00340038C2